MKVRGRRECKRCGTRWAYYETGSITCPDCGSVESVGVGDRELHTASPADLDLTGVRSRVDDDPLPEVAEAAKEACRAYVRKQGFLHAGDLRPLDDTYLAALELAEAADIVGRARDPGEGERLYLLDLLGGAADGDRPDAASVPSSVREARGMAAARGVEDYLGDCRDWLDEHPHPEVRPLVERLGDHRRRVAALQGDVPPAEADALVAAARDLGRYLQTGEEAALAAAEDRLERLA